MRKCTLNVTILTSPFFNFLVIQAIKILLFVSNFNFDLIKVFYLLSMFLISKYFNLKCHHEFKLFMQWSAELWTL